MHLIQLENGEWVNAEHVVTWTCIGHDPRYPGSTDRYSLMSADERLGVTYTDPAVIGAPVVAALPGFAALKYWGDGSGDAFIEAHPVIAWRIGSQYPTPVTVEHMSEPLAIELPDGRVILQADREFTNRQEWMEYEKQSARKEEEKAKALSETASL